MIYEKRLITRIFLALIFAIFGFKIIYTIFSPLTFYLSYLSLIFYNPIIKGNLLIINGFTLKFIPACTAASAYLLLTLLTVLTKGINLKKSILMWTTGSLSILIANLIRIDILIIALIKYGFPLFETLHLFFWKLVSIVYVALVWIFLTYKFNIKTIPIYSDIKYLIKQIKKT